MKRLADWPSRLEAVITAARVKAFDWRTHNCATFAADCVEAVTGERLHERFAKLHKTKRGAAEFSKDAAKLRAEVSMRLDTEVVRSFAQRGDVVLVQRGDTSVLAVCAGRQAVCLGPLGVVLLPMEDAVCAWRI